MKLADAEKFPGSNHWTLYDGRGGVWNAVRYAKDRWQAHKVNGDLEPMQFGRTLRAVRLAVAESRRD